VRLLPVVVRQVITRLPRVTSTVALYGIVPAVKGRPFTVTVPVDVAVGGGMRAMKGPVAGVVVVVTSAVAPTTTPRTSENRPA
jgi:hypothetical protein